MNPRLASSKSRLSSNGSAAFCPLRSSMVNFEGGCPFGSKCLSADAPRSAGIREAPGVWPCAPAASRATIMNAGAAHILEVIVRSPSARRDPLIAATPANSAASGAVRKSLLPQGDPVNRRLICPVSTRSTDSSIPSRMIVAQPGQLGYADALYLSKPVLTSTGFGDVTPLMRPARGVCMIEQIAGALFVAILIARLAGVYPPPRELHRRQSGAGRQR